MINESDTESDAAAEPLTVPKFVNPMLIWPVSVIVMTSVALVGPFVDPVAGMSMMKGVAKS